MAPKRRAASVQLTAASERPRRTRARYQTEAPVDREEAARQDPAPLEPTVASTRTRRNPSSNPRSATYDRGERAGHGEGVAQPDVAPRQDDSGTGHPARDTSRATGSAGESRPETAPAGIPENEPEQQREAEPVTSRTARSSEPPSSVKSADKSEQAQANVTASEDYIPLGFIWEDPADSPGYVGASLSEMSRAKVPENEAEQQRETEAGAAGVSASRQVPPSSDLPTRSPRWNLRPDPTRTVGHGLGPLRATDPPHRPARQTLQPLAVPGGAATRQGQETPGVLDFAQRVRAQRGLEEVNYSADRRGTVDYDGTQFYEHRRYLRGNPQRNRWGIWKRTERGGEHRGATQPGQQGGSPTDGWDEIQPGEQIHSPSGLVYQLGDDRNLYEIGEGESRFQFLEIPGGGLLYRSQDPTTWYRLTRNDRILHTPRTPGRVIAVESNGQERSMIVGLDGRTHWYRPVQTERPQHVTDEPPRRSSVENMLEKRRSRDERAFVPRSPRPLLARSYPDQEAVEVAAVLAGSRRPRREVRRPSVEFRGWLASPVGLGLNLGGSGGPPDDDGGDDDGGDDDNGGDDDDHHGPSGDRHPLVQRRKSEEERGSQREQLPKRPNSEGREEGRGSQGDSPRKRARIEVPATSQRVVDNGGEGRRGAQPEQALAQVPEQAAKQAPEQAPEQARPEGNEPLRRTISLVADRALTTARALIASIVNSAGFPEEVLHRAQIYYEELHYDGALENELGHLETRDVIAAVVWDALIVHERDDGPPEAMRRVEEYFRNRRDR